MKKKLSELTDTEVLLWFLISKQPTMYVEFDNGEDDDLLAEVKKRKLTIDFQN